MPDEPDVTTDPLDPSVLEPGEQNFGDHPHNWEEAEGIEPTSPVGTPAADKYTDVMEEANPEDVGAAIPWEDSLDTRIPPIVNEQIGTVEDEGPPLPDNI